VAARTFLEAPPPDLELFHIELSDRRPASHLGRIDPRNVLFALGAAARLLGTLVRRRPRLVYVPVTQTRVGFLRDSLFFALATLLRTPFLLHVHGGDFGALLARRGMRRYVRFWLRRSAGAVLLAERFREGFSGLAPAIFVVPNGVECVPAPGLREGRRVLFLSNAVREKGLSTLREAMEIVRARRPDAELLEAGEGTRGGPAGPEEKARLLASADLFALPTALPEGQPIAILEAMASGLPVVSTPAGSIPDLVVEGKTGLLVPPRDPRALAEAILSLLSDPARRAAMGAAGAARQAELFGAARFREGLAAAMRAAAGGRPPLL
jgi:glycosyltransferase involved in cell wall biosynthesis